ncbi:alpha/beta hydrolase [Streptacidiphilus sp. PB12-B1b]|uniref:alpha/beta fold hydrolase n=1 Tax=Streptacidiphilus sp. PB12-B1b TaxID=2705012 RepID=UPI0015F987FC|nr:alpha/beta hydrolase [Streptacidiphilus sp. PB12-B1b]QMU77802.1 alpha/beta hydrolase [Streptacidiphilus sp. PB12-B1b]
MAAEVSFPIDTPHGRRTVSAVYHREGSGSPLLLLHGIGHHWQAWQPVLPALAERHDVIAVDLPGFGASPALPAGASYQLGSVVPLLGRVCADLGIERPHVAGNSLGGLLALELGRSGLARSVTALSPAGFWKPWERRYAFAVLLSMRAGARTLPVGVAERLADRPGGRAVLLGSIYARPGRRTRAEALAETAALRSATGFGPTLAAGRDVRFTGDVPDVPVTIGWGTGDRLLLPRQAARTLLEIPRARLVPLPGCGHVPMNDDPGLVADTILTTCAEAEAAETRARAARTPAQG